MKIFRAKAKKKKKKYRGIINRARPSKTYKTSTTPSKARAFKSPRTYGMDTDMDILDLLCLHLKEEGYKASVIHHLDADRTTLLSVDLTDKMPWHGSTSITVPGPAVLLVYYAGGQISIEGPKRRYPLGLPADPELIPRLDGYLEMYLLGARKLAHWTSAGVAKLLRRD